MSRAALVAGWLLAAAAPAAGQCTWVLVRIDAERTRASAVRTRDLPETRCGGLAGTPEAALHEASRGAGVYARRARDSAAVQLRREGGWPAGPGDRWTGFEYDARLFEGVEIRIQTGTGNTTALPVYFDPNRPGTARTKRAYQPRAVDEQAVETVGLQEVGDTETQVVVTFVAGGYVAADRDRFFSDVHRVMSTLQKVSEDVNSEPWPRYSSLTNFYAVFEPSRERGASIPHGPSHNQRGDPYCDAVHGCEPFTTIDNLGCRYGTPHRKMLACEWDKVLTLASYAPVADVVVVLVNQPDVYGGTGDPGSKRATPPGESRDSLDPQSPAFYESLALTTGIATVYNGDYLELLSVHELGHAFAGLSDEYSYGVDESADLGLINCSPNATKWAEFSRLGLVPQAGARPCSYGNYYRPTRSECLMGSPFPRLCPVCREAAVLSFYEKKPALDLSAPRCPGKAEAVVLAGADEALLRVNSEFAGRADVTVRWTLRGNADAYTQDELAAPALRVRAAGFPVDGDYTVTATLLDNTPWVLNSTRSRRSGVRFRHEAEFLVRKTTVSAKLASGCAAKTCQGAGWRDPPFCSLCTLADARLCNLTRVVYPKQYEKSPAGLVGATAAKIWMVSLAACGALAVLLAVFAAGLLRYRATHILEVVVLPPIPRALRAGIVVGSAVAALASAAVLGVSLYHLEKATIFGRPLAAGGVALAALVGVVSLAGVVGAALKAPRLLSAGAALSAALALAALGLASGLLWVSVNIRSPRLRARLQAAWDEAVADRPADVCAVQAELRCSGFGKSCAEVGVGSALPGFCPAACELGNKAADPCSAAFEQFVAASFSSTAAALLAAFALLAAAAAAAVVLAAAVEAKRAEMRRRRRSRLLGLEPLALYDDTTTDSSDASPPGSPAERSYTSLFMHSPSGSPTALGSPRQASASGAGEKKKAKKRGRCLPLSDEEIEALAAEFAKADRDESGSLDADEAMLFWEYALGERPSQIDIQSAAQLVDVNGNGKISFEEFVALYQPFDNRQTLAVGKAPDVGGPSVVDPVLKGAITPAEVAHLRKQFKSLDRGCGVLTCGHQYRDAFRKLHKRSAVDDELAAFVETMDPARTGRIDFDGFCQPYRALRRAKADALLRVAGAREMCALKRMFCEVNEGTDGVLTTASEFFKMFDRFYGRPPKTGEELAAFRKSVEAKSGGVVTVLDFVAPFIHRAARASKLRAGLDEERVEAIRDHYRLLAQPDGTLGDEACEQLYCALYDRNPAEHELVAFKAKLDAQDQGSIGFDDVLRLFAETARATAGKRWLQGQGVTEAEASLVDRDFAALCEVEDGLRMGVPLLGFTTLVTHAAKHGEASPPRSLRSVADAFASFDEDQDGYLDEVEFTKAHYACVLDLWRRQQGIPLAPLPPRADNTDHPRRAHHPAFADTEFPIAHPNSLYSAS